MSSPPPHCRGTRRNVGQYQPPVQYALCLRQLRGRRWNNEPLPIHNSSLGSALSSSRSIITLWCYSSALADSGPESSLEHEVVIFGGRPSVGGAVMEVTRVIVSSWSVFCPFLTLTHICCHFAGICPNRLNYQNNDLYFLTVLFRLCYTAWQFQFVLLEID